MANLHRNKLLERFGIQLLVIFGKYLHKQFKGNINNLVTQMVSKILKRNLEISLNQKEKRPGLMIRGIFGLALFFCIFFSCKDNEKTSHMTSTSDYYKSHCLSCHNYKKSDVDLGLSMYDMSRLDSSILLDKLKTLNRDTLHIN